jgi:diacylglycerol kinase (ATP)
VQRGQDCGMNRPFTLSGRARSFAYAFRGIGLMLRSQHNAWLHALATAGVAAAGIFFQLAPLEWCGVILAMAAVWTAEALNTAFEFLADVASPDFHPLVEKAKDVAAGAVLLAALAAAAVGLIIFYPHLAALAGWSS